MLTMQVVDGFCFATDVHMMFKLSYLSQFPEYLLIGLKRGMSWRALVLDNQWQVRTWSGQLRQNLQQVISKSWNQSKAWRYYQKP